MNIHESATCQACAHGCCEPSINELHLGKASLGVNQEIFSFIEAIKENARKVWPKEGGSDFDFVETLIHVEKKENGDIVICDSYERFFDTMYIIRDEKQDSQWFIRSMFSDRSERRYSYSQAMQDASMMYSDG